MENKKAPLQKGTGLDNFYVLCGKKREKPRTALRQARYRAELMCVCVCVCV